MSCKDRLHKWSLTRNHGSDLQKGSLPSAPAEGHPCLYFPELAPFPQLKHPTASRGLLFSCSSQEPYLTPLAQGLTQVSCFSHFSPQKPVLCRVLCTALWGTGICSLTGTAPPQPHCSVLCITAQGSPGTCQCCSPAPKQLDFYSWGNPATGALTSNWQNRFTTSSHPGSSFSLRS